MTLKSSPRPRTILIVVIATALVIPTMLMGADLCLRAGSQADLKVTLGGVDTDLELAFGCQQDPWGSLDAGLDCAGFPEGRCRQASPPP